MKKFTAEEDMDILTYGIFHAYRDIIEINGIRQKADSMHGTALWRAVLEAIHNSKHVVTHPSVSTSIQVLEIIVEFRIEKRDSVSIYHIRVGEHGLCTATE